MDKDYILSKKDDKKIENLLKIFNKIAENGKSADLEKTGLSLSKESAKLGLLLLNQEKNVCPGGSARLQKSRSCHPLAASCICDAL